VDTYNIDDTGDSRRPVHSILLRENILIVEHMTNLDAIPDGVAFRFYAVPVKVKGFGTFPVRAFAALNE
jgi:kynurenine formamidase